MVDAQTISILFAGLSIAASIVYYASVLQNSNKARQAQVYVQIYDKFSSPDFMENYFMAMAREWKDYDDYTEKYASLRFTNPGCWCLL
jgi:aspartate/glutamate racemase